MPEIGKKLILLVLWSGLALAPKPSDAARDLPGLCEAAARHAAEATGVPLSVLQAIALAESGRDTGGTQRPWPWTVNYGGAGFWYDSSEEAQLAVSERQALGTTNFDVGCFQLNHRWHAEGFDTLAEMFDPERNALYAAQFLTRLYAETGSWSDAAAAYHSRTPEHAARYRARFEELRNGLEAGGQTLLAVANRENLFPLLKAGARGALGSLVPEQAGSGSLLGAAP
jgi:hypothetical protein